MTVISSTPLVDIGAAQAEIYDEIAPHIERILRTGAFIGGPDVAAFEAAYAAYLQVGSCVGVANGTDAVELALRAVGVVAGDDVIVPANTFVATGEAVARIGAQCVLADVDPHTLLLDPAAAAAARTPRTRAVVPVHLYGQAAPVERIAEAVGPDVVVVEDAAQSQGALRFGRPAGSLGQVAATSFYPGKNLGAAGDAGAVVTDDPTVAAAVRLFANHGSSRKYIHDVVGVNSRLDALQAVVLSAKLRRLEGWNVRRREAAARYHALLADRPDVTLPVTLDGNEHVWHLYVVQVPDRDRVLAALQADGIGAAVHYPYPLHLTRAFADLGHGPGSFPVSEHAAARILSLPLHPHITADEQERVVAALGRALERS